MATWLVKLPDLYSVRVFRRVVPDRASIAPGERSICLAVDDPRLA